MSTAGRNYGDGSATHFSSNVVAGTGDAYANSLALIGAAAGSAPQVLTVGDDTNISLQLTVKGTGVMSVVNGAGTIFSTPATVGTNGYVLAANGSGGATWVPQTGASGGLTVGVSTISGGSIGRIFYHAAADLLGEMTTTGNGTVVALATSPVLVTPTLGVASATTINKVAFTTPATGSTLTIIDGKTLTVSKTMSFTAADDTGVYTFPTGTKTLLATTGTPAALVIASQATGDLLYASSATAWARLGVGSNGDVLTLAGGVPTWAAGGGSSSITIGTTPIASGTIGRVLYHLAGDVVGEMTTTGSGTVLALATSPSFTTPAIGVATGTSLTLTSFAKFSGFYQAYITKTGNFTLDETCGTVELLTNIGTFTIPAAASFVGRIFCCKNLQTLNALTIQRSGSDTIDNATSISVAGGGVFLHSDGVSSWRVLGSIGLDISTVAQGDLIYGSAANVLSLLPKNTSSTRYLQNQGGGVNNPNWAQVDLSNGVTGDLPFANITQGSARSVLGVTGNATADVASIQGTANQVLVVNSGGTALAFGAVNLASSAAVTGVLPYVNFVNASGASVLVGRGSASGAGVFQEITLGAGLTMTGTTLTAPTGGSGTVTNTGGNLTSNALVLGAGTADTKVVAGITSDGTSILNLGVNATTIGKVKMFGNTSGDVTITPTAAAGTATVWTLPATSDTFVGKATTDTLTNKTLTGNTAVNLISGSGTLTLNTTGTITIPNGTSTLAGLSVSNVHTTGTNDFTNATSLLVPASAALAPTTIGQFGFDTTQGNLVVGAAPTGVTGIAGTIPRVLSVQTPASDTLTASVINTTETNFATTWQIPANYLVTNKTLRVTYICAATGTNGPNATFKMRLGAVGIGGTTMYTGLANSIATTIKGATVVFYIQGTAAASGSAPVNVAILNSFHSAYGANSAQASPQTNLATDAAENINLTITYSANTAGNSYQILSMIVEEMN